MINELKNFLYSQVERTQLKGSFTHEQKDVLNSIIDEIGTIKNFGGATIKIREFGEKFEEFGGNTEQFDSAWSNYRRRHFKLRMLQKLGHKILLRGKEKIESGELTEEQLNVNFDPNKVV